MWNTFGRNGPENIWNLWGGTCEGENNSIGKSAPGRPREIILIQPGDLLSYSTSTLEPSAHFPQRGLNLKSCVLPIFLQEPLKHLKIDHSGKKTKHLNNISLKKCPFSLGSKMTARNMPQSGPIDLKFWHQAQNRFL